MLASCPPAAAARRGSAGAAPSGRGGSRAGRGSCSWGHYALEPRACVGSVTRQTRRQFCRDIFLICLTDQTNIACFMIIRGVQSFIFFGIFFTDNITILGDMIETSNNGLVV